jgi:ankyrin repeat protein
MRGGLLFQLRIPACLASFCVHHLPGPSRSFAPSSLVPVRAGFSQLCVSMATLPPPINPDNTLNKFPTPTPTAPLAVAASTNDLAALQSASPDSLGKADETGNTPLIWAADAGQGEAVGFLVKAGVDVNHRGFLGNTALARASRGGHVECVGALLAAAGSDPNICNDKKQYPLHFAAFKKKTDCVRALLDSGKCDLSVQDRKGRTPDQDTSDAGIRDMILQAGAGSK